MHYKQKKLPKKNLQKRKNISNKLSNYEYLILLVIKKNENLYPNIMVK